MLDRRRFLAAAAGTGITVRPIHVGAQAVPKPARMLVGLAAGGGVDAVARLLAEHIKGYAQSVIVENRTGASGRRRTGR
jgi:tripartite-type tricarboxylate transporter receptor subunit TctC